MTLDQWLENQGYGSCVKLAMAVGTDKGSVTHWRKGIRPVPSHFCPKISRATNGEVTLQDLRPDVPWLVVGDRTYIEVV